MRPKEGGSLSEAAKTIEAGGGEVLGIGAYVEPGQNRRGFFFRIHGVDAATAATALWTNGYTVL